MGGGEVVAVIAGVEEDGQLPFRHTVDGHGLFVINVEFLEIRVELDAVVAPA